jgi:hypothetical protein
MCSIISAKDLSNLCFFRILEIKSGMVTYVCNPSTLKNEAGLKV